MKATDSDTTDETLNAALEYAVSRNLCQPGDAIVALHRIGSSSVIKIMEVRDIYWSILLVSTNTGHNISTICLVCLPNSPWNWLLGKFQYHAWSHWLDLVRSGESPNITRSIRYDVGVIWFIFHVLQLLPIRSKQQNVCRNSKSTMQHQQNLDWNSDLPQVHACWSLSEHISPPNCVQH